VVELAADLELREEKVTEILLHAAEPRSLSEPLGEDGNGELGDTLEDRSAVSPFDAAAAVLLSGEVNKMLLALDEREREILRLRFGLDRGEPRTLDQVGDHFSLTRERIRQIEARALSKLRHPSTDSDPHELLTG
jgi:RNA polymerase sigma factor (sigma-70 family)